MKTNVIPQETLDGFVAIAADDGAAYNALSDAVYSWLSSQDLRKVFKGFTGLKIGQILVQECNENEVQREQWEYLVWDSPEWVGECHAGSHGHVKQGSGRWNAKQRAVEAAMRDLICRKIESLANQLEAV